MQIQATASATQSNTRHTVKGRLSDLDGAPRLTGELETRAPLLLDANGTQSSSGATYDMRAKIALGSQSATLNNIAVAFDSKGRPQQLTGKAEADWRDGVKTSTTLNSKWLDIDAITGGQTSSMPLRALQLLSGGSIDLSTLGGGGTSKIEISVEQANLGGEVASDLNVKISNANGDLRLDRISAALPGGTFLRADGTITKAKDDTTWQGDILFNGSSLDRFLNWASPKFVQTQGRAGGAFRLIGQFKYTGEQFELSEARVRIAGHESTGKLNYRWSKTPELAVDWTAETVDLTGFGTNLRDPQSLAQLLGLSKPAGKATSTVAAVIADANLNLRLRANKIQDGTESVSNLDVLLARSGGSVQIGRSRLTLDPGLELEIEGNLATSSEQPSWALSGHLRAASVESVEQLRAFAVAVLGENSQPIPPVTSTPLEVAFTTKADRGGETTTTRFEADGSMGRDRIRLSAQSAGPVGQWRAHPLTVDAKIDGQSSTSFFTHLGLTAATAPAANQDGNSGSETSSSHARFRVAGVPEKGLQATAHLNGKQWKAQLRAKAKPAKAGTAVCLAGNRPV